MTRLVIVGAGLAAYTLARLWRAKVPDTPLMIVTADKGDYYSKPMLSTACAKGQTPSQLKLKTAAQMAKALQADIRTATRVTSLDTSVHTLTTSQGETLSFSKLVLACGAESLPLPFVPRNDPRVFSVNHLDDYAAFHAAVIKSRSITILGSGLVGVEFANDLAQLGLTVQVVSQSPWPLDRFVPEPVGRALETALSALGVTWYAGSAIEAVTPANKTVTVKTDSTQLESELVLSALGLKANFALAQSAGLSCDVGIAVDTHLQTSAPDVYALGDCMSLNGSLNPFILPINYAANVLSSVLCGQATNLVWPVMPVTVKTPAYPLVIVPKPSGVEGAWRSEVTKSGCEARYLSSDGRLLGFVLGGDRLIKRPQLLAELAVVSA